MRGGTAGCVFQWDEAIASSGARTADELCPGPVIACSWCLLLLLLLRLLRLWLLLLLQLLPPPPPQLRLVFVDCACPARVCVTNPLNAPEGPGHESALSAVGRRGTRRTGAPAAPLPFPGPSAAFHCLSLDLPLPFTAFP